MNRGLTPEIMLRSVSELRDRKSIREGREIKSRYACFEKLNGRNLKVLMLLSVVLPIGVLVSFRLAGILQEPPIETTTLEAVKWEFQRPHPDQSVPIYNDLNATYVGNGLSVTFSLELWKYLNGSMSWIPPGDWIDMGIRINATVIEPDGFFDDVNIIFRNDSQPSHVNLLHTSLEYANLSLADIAEERNPESYTKAYVKLSAVNRQNRVYFSAFAQWNLLDASSNIVHQLEVTYELTYYNGTTYNKIIQPFQLKLLGDDGNA